MKTPEEQRSEFLEELRLMGERLCSAGGEELSDLLERIKDIKKNIRDLQPMPTEPGTGTTGEASKMMSEGKLPR